MIHQIYFINFCFQESLNCHYIFKQMNFPLLYLFIGSFRNDIQKKISASLIKRVLKEEKS